jgi:hypothetical protein
VLFGLVSLAAIAVGIAAPEIKAFVRTVNLDYLNPNLTWSEHFDGWFNDRVTMELFDDEYRPFMVLYAFPRLPGLDLHRKYYWSNPQEVLFREALECRFWSYNIMDFLLIRIHKEK